MYGTFHTVIINQIRIATLFFQKKIIPVETNIYYKVE